MWGFLRCRGDDDFIFEDFARLRLKGHEGDEADAWSATRKDHTLLPPPLPLPLTAILSRANSTINWVSCCCEASLNLWGFLTGFFDWSFLQLVTLYRVRFVGFNVKVRTVTLSLSFVLKNNFKISPSLGLRSVGSFRLFFAFVLACY